jgi:ParB-like chromosome segregation protein Spo0J/SAM-dependent methyltransferase
MVRLTKAQRKDRERIEAWIEKKPFKENARDKDPQVPKLTTDEVLDTYVPEYISDGAKFYTPRKMAMAFWALASAGYITIRPGMSVLEPCAGIGNLIQPFYDALKDWDWIIDAYELDKEACKIGAKLFHNRVIWHNESPFEDSVQLEGLYDLVIMNPPLRIKWSNDINSEWIESGATNSEHRFLELALRALKPGGQLMVIAPYNYIDKLPKGKGVKAWFEGFATVEAEFGKLPGEFRFTKIQAFGFLIQRVTIRREGVDYPLPVQDEEVIRVGGDSIRQSEIPEEPEVMEPQDAIEFETELVTDMDAAEIKALSDLEERLPEEAEIEEEQTGQIEFSLLPPEILKPLYVGMMDVEEILESIQPFKPRRLPSAEFKRSIQTWGIREPIILTRDDAGNTRLRDGRRRLQAALDLGIDAIQIKVYDLNLISGAALTLDSNAQRSANPMSEYEAIVELLTEAREQGVIVTEKDIHYATGMPVQTIRKRMKLAHVPIEIRDAVAERKVALGVAESIASLLDYQKGQLLDKFRDVGKLTGNDVHEVKQVKQKEEIEGIPGEVFDLPEFDPEHQHQFKPRRVADMGFRCGCGRVLSQDEAINLLNVYLD